MPISRKKNNFSPPERPAPSVFVVDLRRQHPARTEEGSRPPSRRSLKRWLDGAEALRPNLLRSEKNWSLSNVWSRASIWLANRRPVFARRLPRLRRSIVRPLKKISSGSWRSVVDRKRRFLASAPQLRLLSASVARRQEKEHRLLYLYRSLATFVFSLVIIIVPFKLLAYFQIYNVQALEEKVVGQSLSAFSHLLSAVRSASDQDFQLADQDFQAATAGFLAAAKDLNQVNDGLLALASLSSNPKLKLAAESKRFIQAGAQAATLGAHLVAATDSLFSNGEANLASRLDRFILSGQAAVAEARSLETTISRINPQNLPSEYRDHFAVLRQQAGLLASNLDRFVRLAERFKEGLGLSQDKRYLIVFQNNAEMRASGGFIGSYALVDFREGAIRNLEVPGGGSYDTEAGLRVRLAAPEPLWLVNTRWYFWDANWWPDWPTTARHLMWFYERSDGPSVDGVISLTPSVVEKLLAVTGPIDLTEEHGVVIQADNFWETVQRITEQQHLALTHPDLVADLKVQSDPVATPLPLRQGLDAGTDEKPKKIIGDLLVKMMEVLPQKLDRDNLGRVVAIFEESLREKQLLFYFQDQKMQAEALRSNWSGELRSTAGDYLMVVNTNIAGQKTDRLIDEGISLHTQVEADGYIYNTLEIRREHRGVKGEALTGVRNVNWLRIYVPAGSELLDASGFRAPDEQYLQDRPGPELNESPLLAAERAARLHPGSATRIYEEAGKTVFANWSMVDPGETARIILRYRLPFRYDDYLEEPGARRSRVGSWLNFGQPRWRPYTLLVQKQPGAAAARLSLRLLLPEGEVVRFQHPPESSGPGGWSIDSLLDRDRFFSILIENKE